MVKEQDANAKHGRFARLLLLCFFYVIMEGMNGDIAPPRYSPARPGYQAPTPPTDFDSPRTPQPAYTPPAAEPFGWGRFFLKSIVLLVLLAAAAYGGYFYGHKKVSDLNAKLSDATQTMKDLNTQLYSLQQQQATAGRQTADSAYLTIKEKGVKFQLTKDINDAYYYVDSKGNVYFSLHQFDSLKGAEGCKATQTGSGILALITGKVGQPNGTPAGGTWTQQALDQSGMTKVGDTYYGFQKGNAPCWNTTSPPQANFQTTISTLQQDFINQTKTFTQA